MWEETLSGSYQQDLDPTIHSIKRKTVHTFIHQKYANSLTNKPINTGQNIQHIWLVVEYLRSFEANIEKYILMLCNEIGPEWKIIMVKVIVLYNFLVL